MESITKTSLDQHQIKLLMNRHFAGSEVKEIQELKGGMFNTAYLIRGEGALKEGVKDNRISLMEQFDRYNAEVHKISGEWFGYIKDDEHYRFPTWGGAFTCMMQDIIEDGIKRRCRLPYEQIENVMKKYRTILDEVKIPRLVDFDMWAGNIFMQS